MCQNICLLEKWKHDFMKCQTRFNMCLMLEFCVCGVHCISSTFYPKLNILIFTMINFWTSWRGSCCILVDSTTSSVVWIIYAPSVCTRSENPWRNFQYSCRKWCYHFSLPCFEEATVYTSILLVGATYFTHFCWNQTNLCCGETERNQHYSQ